MIARFAPGAPSSDPTGHLLPAGEKGSEAAAACSPFSPRGEGARRADEGATSATKIIRPDIRKHRPAKTTQARQLRQNETEEEYHLWSDLRARRLNGYKFARQVPLGPFIVDFLCREARRSLRLMASSMPKALPIKAAPGGSMPTATPSCASGIRKSHANDARFSKRSWLHCRAGLNSAPNCQASIHLPKNDKNREPDQ